MLRSSGRVTRYAGLRVSAGPHSRVPKLASSYVCFTCRAFARPLLLSHASARGLASLPPTSTPARPSLAPTTPPPAAVPASAAATHGCRPLTTKTKLTLKEKKKLKRKEERERRLRSSTTGTNKTTTKASKGSAVPSEESAESPKKTRNAHIAIDQATQAIRKAMGVLQSLLTSENDVQVLIKMREALSRIEHPWFQPIFHAASHPLSPRRRLKSRKPAPAAPTSSDPSATPNDQDTSSSSVSASEGSPTSSPELSPDAVKHLTVLRNTLLSIQALMQNRLGPDVARLDEDPNILAISDARKSLADESATWVGSLPEPHFSSYLKPIPTSQPEPQPSTSAKETPTSQDDSAAPEKPKKKTKKAQSPPANGASPPAVRRVASKKTGGDQPVDIATLDPDQYKLQPIGELKIPVPNIAHGLDRVLFNSGVYNMQDPRSRVYNFDPYVQNIMPLDQFDFDALKQYVTSSKDSTLINIAKEHKMKYTGSTSSMTSMLSHFHYLLSGWRPINVDMLSRGFRPESLSYTRIMKAPAATFLNWRDGTYAIDADKEFDTANILSMLGKSMEKQLTLPKAEFERYRHINSDQISEEERNAEEAFHYTTFEDFMMRSQLDAYDERLPGTGMFDLKTRAVVSIRMDARGFEKGQGYEITNRQGQWASFEREYYDMIRSAFLKYSLQVRMGRMDGILVAFHNTQRIFGFQYISIAEMDEALHGTRDTSLGHKEFKMSLSLLNRLLDKATKKWPGKTLRIHVETRESARQPFMYFFAKPAEEGEVQAVQSAGKSSVEKFEREVMGMKKEPKPAGATPKHNPEPDQELDAMGQNKNIKGEDKSEAIEGQGKSESIEEAKEKEVQPSASWEEVRQSVEDAMQDDEVGVNDVRDSIQEALERSGLLEAMPEQEKRQYADALLNLVIPTAFAEATSPHTTVVDFGELTAGEETHETAQPSDTTSSDGSTRGRELWESILKQHEEGRLPRDPETLLSLDDADQQEPGSETTARESAEPVPFTADTAEISGGLSPLRDMILQMAKLSRGEPFPQTPDTRNDDKYMEFERVMRSMITADQLSPSDPSPNTDNGGPETADKVEVERGVSFEEFVNRKRPTKLAKLTKRALLEEAQEPPEDIIGMVLTVKNKKDGAYVERPEGTGEGWTVEYCIEEMPSARASRLYKQTKTRRQTVFQEAGGNRDMEWKKMFGGALPEQTRRGRLYREKEDTRNKDRPVHIMGVDGPKTWTEAFAAPKPSPPPKAAGADGVTARDSE